MIDCESKGWYFVYGLIEKIIVIIIGVEFCSRRIFKV